jgi:hypothetical protein
MEVKVEQMENIKDHVDIHKLIDDAMEKKDRNVAILISPIGIKIDIYPYKDDKPRWIDIGVYYTPFKCSECGCVFHDHTPYCPSCGEKLAAPEEEKNV